MSTSPRLAGKVALVTGAGSGFGRAISLRFASEGCSVLVGDINEAGAADTVAAMGGSAKGAAVRMDVTQEADWKNAIKEAEAKFSKPPDIIVNNAGWSYKSKVSEKRVGRYQISITDLLLQPTLEVTEAEFDRVFDINVKSIFWSVQAAVPALRKNGGGSIISISSIGSVRPRPGLVWCKSSIHLVMRPQQRTNNQGER